MSAFDAVTHDNFVDMLRQRHDAMCSDAADRIAYLSAQEDLLQKWQDKADRLESEIAETKRPLAEQMERLNRRVIDLQAQCAKAERRAIAFGDCLHSNILAMRAAVVAGHLESHAIGLQWIVNSLEGPGHLPDLDEARELGGAQALFDKETAEHEAFRAAHPVPGKSS